MNSIIEILLYIDLLIAGGFFVGCLVTIPYSFKNRKLYSEIDKIIESKGYEFNKSLIKKISRKLSILLPIINVDEYKKGKKLLEDKEKLDIYIDILLMNRQLFESERLINNRRASRFQSEIDDFQRDPYKAFKEQGVTREEAIRLGKDEANNPYSYLWSKIIDGYNREEEQVKQSRVVPSRPKHPVRVKQLEKAKRMMR